MSEIPKTERKFDKDTKLVKCSHQSGFPLGDFILKITNTGFGFLNFNGKLYCFELDDTDPPTGILVSSEDIPT